MNYALYESKRPIIGSAWIHEDSYFGSGLYLVVGYDAWNHETDVLDLQNERVAKARYDGYQRSSEPDYAVLIYPTEYDGLQYLIPAKDV